MCAQAPLQLPCVLKPPGGEESSGVLVVEDLEADGDGVVVGICGAFESPEGTSAATTQALSTYISVRDGREIDELTEILLARALRGWLGKEAGGGASGVVQEEEQLALDGGEVVDWVDTEGRVICALPRPVVHSRNVLHRGAGVMIRNDKARRRCFYTCCVDTVRCRVGKQYLAHTLQGVSHLVYQHMFLARRVTPMPPPRLYHPDNVLPPPFFVFVHVPYTTSGPDIVPFQSRRFNRQQPLFRGLCIPALY